jgi:lipopolysaccharide biosynthesis glycosyltransferase
MKHAYVTMMCGGDGYLAGVEALGRSLVETGTKVPRVVMVTPDVSAHARTRLESQGWATRLVEPVPSPPKDVSIYARFANSYTKLRAFDLIELDKLVFLDADTVVLSSIDELFERPHFAAAPDFFMPDRFNSGVMVLAPAHALYEELVSQLGHLASYDGGDQGLLNSHWPDWWSMPVEHRLGAGYNLHHFVYQFMSSHPALIRSFTEEIKIIHYTLQKPWQQFNLSGGSEVWWKKFYSANPAANNTWRRRLHAFQDHAFDRVVGMLGG